MRFGAAVTSGILKTFVYSGRASRSEFWWFVLFMHLLWAVPYAGIASGWIPAAWGPAMVAVLMPVELLLGVSQCALATRRLHDVGRSGWWLLVDFLPLVGRVVVLFWMLRRGDAGDNRFGPDPLGRRDARLVAAWA